MINKTAPVRSLFQVQCRSVSSKYIKPFPRTHRRRLFEAGVAPEVPKAIPVCISPGVYKKELIAKENENTDVEVALSKLVKRWMVQEEFRVMAICQFLPVPGRTLWLSKNQLRIKGIHFRTYGNKIMKKVFEGTPLSSLELSLAGTNAFLFAKDHLSIKTIIEETDKLNWIVPLSMAVDDRILAIEEAKALAKLSSLEDLRAHTVQLLGQQVAQLSLTLDLTTRLLPNTLDYLSTQRGDN